MRLFSEFLNEIASSLAKNLAQGLVYIAITALFIVALIKCIMPVMQARGQLKRGVRRIRRNDNKDED